MKSKNDYYLFIKENISLKEICDKLGVITKAVGNDYLCSCIFHDDPNPSMHIYTETNSFYCFECHRGGNVFTFLQQKLDCSFHECVLWLEKEYSDILNEKPVQNRSQDTFAGKSGFHIAYDTYSNMTAEEKEQMSLYAKERGYQAEFLIKRDIFFAKGKKLHDTYALRQDEHIEEMEMLKACQLLRPLPLGKGHKSIHYDDFCQEDRIIIVLRDEKGEIKGFAARSVRRDSKHKYLFSRNLKKAEYLYRLDNVGKRLGNKKEAQRIFVVEGFFDALRLEERGQLAVAILGNTITDKQVKLLESSVGGRENNVSLQICLDTDEAGQRGTSATIARIWKNRLLKKFYLGVVVLKGGYKDPDDAWRENERVKAAFYSAFEFLMRYYIKSSDKNLAEINLSKNFESLSVEERISFLHRVEDLLPRQEWKVLFEYYDAVIDGLPEGKGRPAADFAYEKIRHFILGGGIKENVKVSEPGLFKTQTSEERNYRYRMQTALRIVRTSYEREEVSLDEGTWSRIEFGADAFFDYLYQSLQMGRKGKSVIPLFVVYVPKTLGVLRKKAMYCHEDLLVQQYVLNELLSAGDNTDYERSIPAVRYRAEVNTYLTGYQYEDLADEVVSFAYQIDMAAINGKADVINGMFRPFYDCWKQYIEYVQEGIEKLESETIYRVKLDIQGFYDHLRRFVIRDALLKSIQEAFCYDENRFQCFRAERQNSELAETVVTWILDELFRTEYYNPNNGELEIKAEEYCGIPQGPNLSAYVANIALFSVDQKATEIVRRVNADCKDGKIKARYARYVDDMIIVAATPDILMEIRGAIAAQLYDLGLNLSPKTDTEDGISKEEAFDWTTEERGGFGVSAGFDLADDSFDALIEEYEDYEVTDRRGALRLLQSNMYSLLYEGTEWEEDYEQFIKIFFQTEDIRYRDIVRFSELLLYYAAKEDSNIVEAYEVMWKYGLTQSTENALFYEDGLSALVLLEGCTKILRRQRKGRNFNSREKWKPVEAKICRNWKEICRSVREAVLADNVLGKNKWALEMKMLEFCQLAECEIGNEFESVELKNEYGYRWYWETFRHASKIIHYKPDNRAENVRLLQNFHFCIEVFMKMQRYDDYKELKSQFVQYLSQYKAGGNILLDCIRIWFFDGEGLQEEKKEVALRVLLNTVPLDYRAEVVNDISGLREYIFEKDRSEFLPVYSGIGYPGIMTVLRSEKNKYITKINRVDFKKNEDNVLEIDRWAEDNNKYNEWTLYRQNLGNAEYIDLNTFCNQRGKLNACECMRLLNLFYFPIVEAIMRANERIKREQPDKRMILSARNVLVKVERDKVIDIDITNTYLVSRRDTTNAVAMKSGSNDDERYTLKNVHENGSEYWTSGYLLYDAMDLRSVFLHADESQEEKRDTDMLEFTMKRLYGYSIEKYDNVGKSVRSFRKSVERSHNLLKQYLSSAPEGKELCLENARIVNSFIKSSMERRAGEAIDFSIECAIWSKNYLRYGFYNLMPLLEHLSGSIKTYSIKRRVPKWYYMLAERVDYLYRGNEKYSGFRVLSAGLYADALLMHLRMQTLECIYSFTAEEKRQFMVEEDFPLSSLALGEEDLLILSGDIRTVYRNLVSGEKYDKNIKKITHLGWLVILAKVCEIDKNAEFIVCGSRIKRDEVRKNLCEVADIIKFSNVKAEKAEEDFPFQHMDEFFSVWRKENVIRILGCLQKLDVAYGVIVQEKKSAYYSQRLMAKRVHIETEREKYEELPYFLTYGKRDKNVKNEEKSIVDSSLSIYTQTVIGKKVVGFCVLDSEFGKVLQEWEAEVGTERLAEIEKNSSVQKVKAEVGEEKSNRDVIEKVEQSKDHDVIDKKEDLSLCRFQIDAWGRRGKTKFFENADRIALFQFRIDSSYKHPLAELCVEKKMMENEVKTSGRKHSCAEFRRRKLLEPVMKTCELFGVEILLLPEYSLRPETVQWMCKQIQEKKYGFSVWAGTFRVPAGYLFDGQGTIDNRNLNKDIYWHSAPLPVLVNEGGGDVRIAIKKFKKYPSVALKEDINPAPAYGDGIKFDPVMYQCLYDYERKKLIPFFGDARDDVTELICAELFAVASISNYPSFLKESLSALARYTRPNLIKNKGAYENYREKFLEDLRHFGDFTAIYQRKRYMRRPILLVPACTTRAVDYYVFGQGFYLSAGLKTVFCNAVGTGGRGGSCFIGPDSWDDSRLNKDKFLMENTPYHGLKPGIFMQTSSERNRGALGEKEEALLICDIYPDLDRGNPNAESMMSALSLVAHIPIFEDRSYKGICEENKNCLYLKTRDRESELKTEQSIKKLELVKCYCERHKDGSPDEMTYLSSSHDIDTEKKDIVKAMKELGEIYDSKWFSRRAEYYEQFHMMYPQAWPPPALTDWLYVKIDYDEFQRAKNDFLIQIPKEKEV